MVFYNMLMQYSQDLYLRNPLQLLRFKHLPKFLRCRVYCQFIFILCFSNPLFFNILFSENYEYSDENLDGYDFNPAYCKKVSEVKGNDEPAPLANLEGEPSAYVHGCVNVITGMYCEFNTDLIVHHGTDPLCLERSFAGCTGPSTIGGGWQRNHQSALKYKKSKKKAKSGENCLYADDHGGRPLNFIDYGGYNYRLVGLRKEVTNTSQSFISGQSNLRNLKFVADNTNPKMITGSSLRREFSHQRHDIDNVYKLEKEIKPNGNQNIYSYSQNGHNYILNKIELLNHKNQSRGFIQYAKGMQYHA